MMLFFLLCTFVFGTAASDHYHVDGMASIRHTSFIKAPATEDAVPLPSPIIRSTEDAPLPSPILPDSIFLLAGQSNMAGRGGDVQPDPNCCTWDKYVPKECQPNPRILRLDENGVWEEASEPLHQNIDTRKQWGVGPGMSFANYVLKNGGKNIGVIGLVPCADGGRYISEWARDTLLFGRLVTRATIANASAGAGKIRAMLWYQGENEASCSDKKVVEEYKGRLDEFFTNLRVNLSLPLLPIIQVALDGPETKKAKYKNEIRQAQFNNTLPRVVTVDANGLPLESDNVHLTSTSQAQLGQKLAQAFLQNFNTV